MTTQTTRRTPSRTHGDVTETDVAEAAVSVRDIHKSYDDRAVLSGVSFDVSKGQVFALLGPNGAGKTTLIRILTTLIKPSSGTASVLGHDLTKDPARVRELISVTGQYASVDEELTGMENLVMIGRLLGESKRGATARADELLAEFDLTDAGSRRVGLYSGGMRRRLDLAAGLISSPPVIFLDEPTTGMDTRSRSALWNVVTRLAEQGKTIFLTTQYLEEADTLADRIAVLDGGTIVASGTAQELKRQVGGESIELVLDDGTVAREATEGDPERVRQVLNAYHAAGKTVRTFSVHAPTLDDAFLALTGHPAARAPQDTKENAR